LDGVAVDNSVTLQPKSKIDVRDVTVEGNTDGITGGALLLKNVIVQNNTYGGVGGTRVSMTNVQVLGNAYQGVDGGRVSGVNIVVRDNGNTFVPNFQSEGINCPGTLTLFKSDVSNNGVSPTFPFGLDILTTVRPRVHRTTCGFSSNRDLAPMPWGVCAHDQ
jgi:hypothetical protein